MLPFLDESPILGYKYASLEFYSMYSSHFSLFIANSRSKTQTTVHILKYMFWDTKKKEIKIDLITWVLSGLSGVVVTVLLINKLNQGQSFSGTLIHRAQMQHILHRVICFSFVLQFFIAYIRLLHLESRNYGLFISTFSLCPLESVQQLFIC
jgi:hypothetical protein